MSEHRPNTESELIELVRAIDVRAPERLHLRVRELVAEQEPMRRRRGRTSPPRRLSTRGVALGGGLTALAALAVVLVLALSGGGSQALSVGQASALTLRAATIAPPAESLRQRGTLTAAVEGVSFPYWKGRFGWRASGARADRIAGRAVRTVFYANSRGQRIGYAIVAGTPAPPASGGTVVWRGGTQFRLLLEHGVPTVVWLRAGRLCVVAGRGVSSATLLGLAS